MAIGQSELARSYLRRAEEIGKEVSEPDPVFLHRLAITKGFLQFVDGEIGGALAGLAWARAGAESIGDAWGRAAAGCRYVAALAEAGAGERAEAAAADVIAFCKRVGLVLFSGWSSYYLAAGMRNASRSGEAEALLRPLLDLPDPLLRRYARALLAHVLIASGDLSAAEREADAILQETFESPAARAAALGALAVLRLRQGAHEQALAHADAGLESASAASWPRDASILRLARAEALWGLGRQKEALAAMGEARDRVLRIASTLDDPSLRASYSAMEEHRRTLELAGEWAKGSLRP
jgi:hypothetical protein